MHKLWVLDGFKEDPIYKKTSLVSQRLEQVLLNRKVTYL